MRDRDSQLIHEAYEQHLTENLLNAGRAAASKILPGIGRGIAGVLTTIGTWLGISYAAKEAGAGAVGQLPKLFEELKVMLAALPWDRILLVAGAGAAILTVFAVATDVLTDESVQQLPDHDAALKRFLELYPDLNTPEGIKAITMPTISPEIQRYAQETLAAVQGNAPARGVTSGR